MLPKKGLALLIASGKKPEMEESEESEPGKDFAAIGRELRLAIKDDDDEAIGEVLQSLVESMGE